MKIVIDTNVYIEFFRGNQAVRDKIHKASGIYISAVVMGELIYGFRHGTRFAENRRELESFLSEPYVTFLPVTLATCERFGMIAAELRRLGKPIPQNDIWIAAHALESGSDLLSFDGHFSLISGLVFNHLKNL